MKNFKDLLSEVAQPKSAEERRFKDQHTIELVRHPVALDSQFTGEVEGLVKQKRPADSTDGDDVTKYDAAYLTKNKQAKAHENIDAKDSFKEDNDYPDYPENPLSFKDLLEKFSDSELDLSESSDERINMMLRQLHFISYAAEEIMDYLAIDETNPRGWWQNKLTTAFIHMQTLHSYIEGDKRMMDTNFSQDSADLSDYYKGYSIGAYEHASFKAGDLVLENKEIVELNQEDAETLSIVLDSLEESNRKLMHDMMFENKEGFQEVLEFAKEVLE